MSEPLNVVIGIPSGDTWCAEFGMSLLSMFVYYLGNPISGYDPPDGAVYSDRGSVLPMLRQKIVQKAIEKEATHLLFVDTDQVFPVSTLTRLLRHHKDVVACNIATKSIPASPTARKKTSDPKGFPIFTTEHSKGLERVWRIGTGVMLINLRIFSKMPKPWFPIEWAENGEQCVGEDWGFCKKLDHAGIPIYIDHELSWEIEHLGRLRYGHQHVLLPAVEQASAQVLSGLKSELTAPKYAIFTGAKSCQSKAVPSIA